jgi:hypothetical protein
MLLNKIHRAIMSFIVARTIQGTFATPVSQGSGSGLISRDAPKAFFYDPRYMPALDALTIPAEGKCNMLISKKDVGQDVSTGTQGQFRRLTHSGGMFLDITLPLSLVVHIRIPSL